MLFVLAVSVISICLFILHSYCKRGARLTFNFFLFASIVTFIKEAPGRRFDGVLAQDYAAPFEFLAQQSPVIVGSLTGLLGWIFIFYLGWSMAERIIQRAGTLSEYVFPVLFLSALVIGSTSYGIEATAIKIGWWRWKIEDLRFAEILIGVPFISFEAWINFSLQYLLLPYLLIQCSTLRHAFWKSVFFIIPFTHNLLTNLQLHEIRKIGEGVIFFAIIALSFTNCLRFDLPTEKARYSFTKFRDIIEVTPIYVLLLTLSILAFFDIAVLKDCQLLITLLPAAVIILLAIKKIPLYLIAILTITLVSFIGVKAIPAFIPVIIISMLSFFTKISRDRLITSK